MKQTSNVFKTHFLFLAVSAIALSSCQKAAERKAELDADTASSIMAMADITEVTSEVKDPKNAPKALYVTAKSEDIDKKEYGLKQVAIVSGDKADSIMKKVTRDDTKKIVDEQLKSGAVGFVIVNGDDGKPVVKIVRVVPDTELSNKYNGDILSLKYMRATKELSKETDSAKQSSLSVNLKAWKYKAPKDWGEKFGLVEITQIKITKMGIIENLRTEYGEKKSILGLTEKPMGQATHFLIGEEAGSEADAAATAAAAKAEVK